jgi:hypothetical protein
MGREKISPALRAGEIRFFRREKTRFCKFRPFKLLYSTKNCSAAPVRRSKSARFISMAHKQYSKFEFCEDCFFLIFDELRQQSQS